MLRCLCHPVQWPCAICYPVWCYHCNPVSCCHVVYDVSVARVMLTVSLHITISIQLGHPAIPTLWHTVAYWHNVQCYPVLPWLGMSCGSISVTLGQASVTLWALLCFAVFSSTWLCQQSSWYGPSTCHPSVVRHLHSQSVSQLSLNLSCAFLSNFSSRLPWGWNWVEVDTFEKNNIFCFFLWIFQFLDNIIPSGSKNFKMLLLPQITFESFQTFFKKILPSGPHKSTILDFWNFGVYDFSRFFFFVFVNTGPYGSKNSQTLLLPQITFELF